MHDLPWREDAPRTSSYVEDSGRPIALLVLAGRLNRRVYIVSCARLVRYDDMARVVMQAVVSAGCSSTIPTR